MSECNHAGRGPAAAAAAGAYRGRLAPSPTGRLHLGHARTYLVAWLRARQAGGSLVLRLEDLDTPRVVPGAAEAIYRDLEWLGLDWDEGPERGGPCGPYVQSQRLDQYQAAVERLLEAGACFPCSCSRREIAATASAPHGLEELGPRYPGTCRMRPASPGKPTAIRFAMDFAPAFDDALHGRLVIPEAAGDFVVRRTDGLFAYQLAVVVDDAAMAISEVVRGDDLRSSTPRQLALYRVLGLPAPSFLHVPLVLGDDGARLSKRHGSTAIAELRDAGESPERVLGRLAASLGVAGAGAAVGLVELVDAFELSQVPGQAVTV